MRTPLIDTNVHVFDWPFRHLPAAAPEKLAAMLKDQRVARAFVGSFESIFHRDIDSVNRRLADACRKQGSMTDGERPMWVPFGTVHLGLPDWREDLRRCRERYRMVGIRLYPNYHRYRLDSDTAMEFFGECLRQRLAVQVVMSLEDARTQHPLVRVPPVDPDTLLPAVERFRDLPLMLLNAFRETPRGKLERLQRAGKVMVEIATLERAAGLERLLESIPIDRICYGSNSPLFYPSAARLKLETAAIGAVQRKRIAAGNAAAWYARTAATNPLEADRRQTR